MSDATECLVLVDDGPCRGSWNMALDEALLDAAAASGMCAARVYEWSEATISLGYFQQGPGTQADAATDGSALDALPRVRRLSGGGAILHHHELTYSCVVPPGHRLAREPLFLYDAVHEAIVGLLQEWGVQARRRAVAEPAKDAAFLCFGRGDPRDLLVAGQKIVGSAQRRRKGAVLQHGSLLLRRSRHAPQFAGLLDLALECRLPANANRSLALAVAGALGRPTLGDPPEVSILQNASALEHSRYLCVDWKRDPV
jgi:lipoate-protein ligase A